MTFKPTHYFNPSKIPVQKYADGYWREETGAALYVVENYLDPIPLEEPVSLDDNPQVLKGKRYRIEFACEQDDYVGYVSDYVDIKVELLPDPLPTTPGSVLKTLGGAPLFRGADAWVNEHGVRFDLPSDADVFESAIVLFDAGAPRK